VPATTDPLRQRFGEHEHKGHRYRFGITGAGWPYVESLTSGNFWLCSWKELLAWAIAEAVDRPYGHCHQPKEVSGGNPSGAGDGVRPNPRRVGRPPGRIENERDD
jgi:hypothetical protein